MAKFKFRLAPLLKLRESVRDERRSELAEAYHADDLLQQQIDQAKQQMQYLQESYRKQASPGTVDVDRLVESQRHELLLKTQEKQLLQQKRLLTEEIERRRLLLVEANREVRVLEKLREKQSLRHQDEENRQQVKHLDEVASQRAAREVVS